MKYITGVILLISMYCRLGGAHGQTSITINDCSMVTTHTDVESSYTQNASNILDKYDSIISKQGMIQALQNLKSYCCQIKQPIDEKLRIGCQNFISSNTYPESPYLYDHLIDVTAKRLDAIPLQPYGLNPDPTGKDRREYINQLLSSSQGSRPQEISDRYKQYRAAQNTQYLTYTTQTCANITSQEYTNFSLGDKYLSICTITRCIYDDLVTAQQATTQNIVSAAYDTCKNMIESRVSAEHTLAKTIMIQKANRLLEQSRQSYIHYYFMDRLHALQETSEKVRNDLQTINQTIVEGTRQCSS